MTFKLDDGGRSKSKRPRQRADCAVRSLAIVLRLPYDHTYDILAKAGRKSCKPFDLEAWARKNFIAANGFGDSIFWRLSKMPFTKDHHAVGPQSRYRVWDFLKDNPEGDYIVSTAAHVFAVKDGVAHDDEPWHFAEDRPVYGWLEACVVPYPDELWQVSAARRPIKKGSPKFKRSVAIVPADNYKQAMRVASKLYEWAIRKDEDLGVEPLGEQ